MKMVTWVAKAGRLLICSRRRPSLRQTKGKSLEVIITAERMSVGPLGSEAAAGLKGKQSAVLTDPHGNSTRHIHK